MQVLSKKRIVYLMIFSIVPIFIANFKINKNSKIKNPTVDTMAMPVTSKTIVIDAGHGGEDEGC